MTAQDRKVVAKSGTYNITGSPVTIRLHMPLPEDHPMLTKIGRVTSEWSIFEHMLDRTVWWLSDLPPAEAAEKHTKQLKSHEQRFKKNKKLLESKPAVSGEIPSWDALKLKADAISLRRHRIIHDTWHLEKKTGETAQWRSMPLSDPYFGMVDITPADIDKLIDDIVDLRNEVAPLLKRLP